MEPLILVLIFGGGFVAGIINTLAGGGSLITLPLLILAGLPANVANGTNRVAIVLQNVGALSGFRSQGLTLGREVLWLLLPTLAGAAVGVHLAVGIDEALLRRMIGGLLVIMLIPILLRRKPSPRPGAVRLAFRPWLWPVYFVVGIYGGFLQAGVGFLFLGLLAGVEGLDLVRANLVKVFLILSYSILAVTLFFFGHQVALGTGLVLAVGMTAGGWIGAHLAVRKGESLVRVVLAAAVIASAVHLTGLGKILGAWLGRGGG